MIRRHKLKTCSNMRDIGGYQGDSVTKYNEFIRSDNVSLCTVDEIEYISRMGVKTIIDLRSSDELEFTPNIFASYLEFEYFNVPLIEETEAGGVDWSFELEDMYISVVKNMSAIKELFNVISECPKGGVLYHCTAGKDRTGITTCLLLMLAGVDKYDIAADHEVSYTYLTPKRVAFKKMYPDVPLHMMKSNPELILNVYDYITEEYGTITNYLLDAGVSDATQEKIRRKLCTDC